MTTGYIFNFTGHGAFSPDGKIPGELSQAEIDAHSARLAVEDMRHIKETGRGILYLFSTDGKPSHVGTWASAPSERIKISNYRKGSHNIARERLDVWFYLDGKLWHGVNIGDNELVRIKRNK